MPTITGLKARQMILEASRQHTQARSNDNAQQSTSESSHHATMAEERCKHCRGRHPTDECWIEHPEDAPNWFKDKMKEMAKEKETKGRQARRFQGRVAYFPDDREVHITV